MKRSLRLLLVVLLQAVSSLCPGHEGFHTGFEAARQPDPGRTWRFSNTDGFVRGNFLLCRDGAVSIQRSTGEVVVIPLGQLSQADRDYAADRLGRIERLNTHAPMRLVSLQAGGRVRLESPRPPPAKFFQAFERKGGGVRGTLIIGDLGARFGVNRIRFYPRNTVHPAPTAAFQNDFLRAFELFVNDGLNLTADGSPLWGASLAEEAQNTSRVVDIELDPPRYIRSFRLRSATPIPFEIDEIEVYGTGFLQSGQYLTDLIDLGERATIGPIRWVENSIEDVEFSELDVRIRTGHDDTPLLYRRLLPNDGFGPRGVEEVSPVEYFRLGRVDRAPFATDVDNWSPYFPIANGQLITAPSPRRYVQFQIDFSGGLFQTRELDRLEFDYITPPIADKLVAEVFPRLANAEEAATFRYAVRLRRDEESDIRGFDRLEVDTNVGITDIREIKLNGVETDFDIEFIREDAFAIRFPRITKNDALLELTFDLPIFRFGTTFSGRAYDTRAPSVPQALVAGHAIYFGPGDVDELSGLAVSIPKPQIGKLVGEIAIKSRVFTPNGDGVNDQFEFFFNILQLTRDAPVRFEIYDLAGRRLHTIFTAERGIGPVTETWDGKLADGSMLLPGTYLWVLRVKADAFNEVHSGTMAVAY